MAELKFRAGDIVMNIFAGEGNQNRYLLYLRKGTVKQGIYQHKTYDCIGYDGEKVKLFRDNEPLVCVGHMAEYDDFISALRRLKNMEQEV